MSEARYCDLQVAGWRGAERSVHRHLEILADDRVADDDNRLDGCRDLLEVADGRETGWRGQGREGKEGRERQEGDDQARRVTIRLASAGRIPSAPVAKS